MFPLAGVREINITVSKLEMQIKRFFTEDSEILKCSTQDGYRGSLEIFKTGNKRVLDIKGIVRFVQK